MLELSAPGRRFRSSLAVSMLFALLATSAAQAQGELFRPGTATPPPRTDDGNWAGTWHYTSRDFRVALWLKDDDGQVALRLRYLNIGTGEGFETDWTGAAEYVYVGWPGSFRMELTAADADTLSANWLWELKKGDSTRIERARVTVYRTVEGRQAVMQFDDFVRAFQLSKETHEVPASFFWVLRKASTRLVLWEELPF